MLVKYISFCVFSFFHQPNFEVMLGMQRFLNLGELIMPPEVNEEDLFYLR